VRYLPFSRWFYACIYMQTTFVAAFTYDGRAGGMVQAALWRSAAHLYCFYHLLSSASFAPAVFSNRHGAAAGAGWEDAGGQACPSSRGCNEPGERRRFCGFCAYSSPALHLCCSSVAGLRTALPALQLTLSLLLKTLNRLRCRRMVRHASNLTPKRHLHFKQHNIFMAGLRRRKNKLCRSKAPAARGDINFWRFVAGMLGATQQRRAPLRLETSLRRTRARLPYFLYSYRETSNGGRTAWRSA